MRTPHRRSALRARNIARIAPAICFDSEGPGLALSSRTRAPSQSLKCDVNVGLERTLTHPT